jgi:DNA-binding IclR family transcriptional regulator
MPPREHPKSFIASIRTGLQALEAVSSYGVLSTTDLARVLRISRGKAHRVLRTLEHCGYVVNQGGAGGYLLTRRVAAMSAAPVDRLGAIAAPLLTAWTREHGWPLRTVVLLGDRLAIAATSDSSSNLARTRSRTGAESPLNFDGAGVMLLATLPAKQRAVVLRAGLAPQVQAEFPEKMWARSFADATAAGSRSTSRSRTSARCACRSRRATAPPACWWCAS